jgi:hypothetical protein
MKLISVLCVLCLVVSVQASTKSPSRERIVVKARRICGSAKEGQQVQQAPQFDLLELQSLVTGWVNERDKDAMDRREEHDRDDAQLAYDLGFPEDELKARAKLRAQQETESKGKSQAQVVQKNKDTKLNQ